MKKTLARIITVSVVLISATSPAANPTSSDTCSIVWTTIAQLLTGSGAAILTSALLEKIQSDDVDDRVARDRVNFALTAISALGAASAAGTLLGNEDGHFMQALTAGFGIAGVYAGAYIGSAFLPRGPQGPMAAAFPDWWLINLARLTCRALGFASGVQLLVFLRQEKLGTPD